MLKKSSQVGFGADFSTYQFLATLISVPLTLAFHVLKFSLNNLSWSKYKRWSLYLGEGHARRWHLLESILHINFEGLPIFVNSLTISH
jgi:hypothetical protein